MAPKDECIIMTPECEKRFDDIDTKLEKMFNRLFVSNGRRSLIERIRDNEQELVRHKDFHDKNDKVSVEVPDPKDPSKTIRMQVGPKGISTQNMKPMDVFMTGIAIVAVLLLGLIVLERFGFVGNTRGVREVEDTIHTIVE